VSRRTGAAGRPNVQSLDLGTKHPGGYTLRWYVGGRLVRSWSFELAIPPVE
jgi:hypothetical protein